jgi:heme-degrading monooxygenase HmoA
VFAVIFEVYPKPDKWDDYLALAKILRPELEKIDGFVDNIRYRSLTREGWLLSFSTWRDEKSVVRWRTDMRHHMVQEKGRLDILVDYHLRVGEVVRDTQLPQGHILQDQRLDETQTGEAAATFVTGVRPGKIDIPAAADETADLLGLDRRAVGLVTWDVFEAILAPGEIVLMMSWRDKAAARAFEIASTSLQDKRLRHIRVVRDYGMFDRREAPQYYADVERSTPL